MDIKKIFSLKNMSTAGKIALAITVPSVALAGYYVVDRIFIKQAPLFPFSLEKAREKQATDSLIMAKKKLKKIMDEGKINSYGTRQDAETKKYYIEVGSSNITSDLRNQIPSKVSGVEVRLVQKEMAVAQKN